MRWASQHAVLLISVVLAAGSAILVPPNAEYLAYFDLPTLAALFCMLACISALHGVNFFQALAERVVTLFSTLRGAVIGLILATACASALFTNDMALIALLPLAYLVLSATNHLTHVPFVFVMMTIAANLGGMVTPFGSPQNLYLYSKFAIESFEFVRLMVVPWAASMLVLMLLCLAVPRTPLGREPRAQPTPSPVTRPRSNPVDTRRTVLYLALFVLTVCMVLRLVPLWATVIVALVLLLTDRPALARLDWGLLGTFVAFFVFAGNLSRIPLVTQTFVELLQGSVLLWSAISSQIISNVPSAILLAQFTDNYAELLVGVNVGGVGTLIASLASLITLNELRKLQPAQTRRFLATFAWLNALFFVMLLGLSALLFATGMYSSA